MLRDIEEAVVSKWPAARVHQFGSQSAGLAIFLSDVDVSILGLGLNEDEKKSVVEPSAEQGTSVRSSPHPTSSRQDLQNEGDPANSFLATYLLN